MTEEKKIPKPSKIPDPKTQIVLAEDELAVGLSLSPDGLLAVARVNGAAVVWNVSSGERVYQTPSPHTQQHEFTPSGEFLAILGKEGMALHRVGVWHVEPRIIHFNHPPSVSQRDFSFSRDGRWLAVVHEITAGESQESLTSESWIAVYDVFEGKSISEFARRRSSVYSGKGIGRIAFSPDAGLLALTDATTLEIWDVKKGRFSYEFRPTIDLDLIEIRGFITGLAFSPDGTRLATSHLNNMLIVWDLATQKDVRILQTGGVLPIVVNEPKVAFSPDGQYLVGIVGSYLGVWETSKWNLTNLFHHPVGPLVLPTFHILPFGGFSSLSLSGNGKILAVKATESHPPNSTDRSQSHAVISSILIFEIDKLIHPDRSR